MGSFKIRARNLLWAAGLLVVLMMPAVVAADTTISKGYTTEQKLALGAMVSLQGGNAEAVSPSSTKNVGNLLGVVIDNSSSLLSITSDADKQVQVATNGTAQVLVSDINGTIVEGDHITASPISGVGMKATGNVRILGVAQSNMAGGKKETYKDDKGVEHSVNIGQVPVVVNVAYYFKEPDKTLIPQAVQNLANALAGKTVSSIPILISAGIFLVMLIVVASIVFSMVKGSIVSVGRNPMSQAAVYRNMIQMSAVVIVILGVGLGSIFLVLTRVG